jgi:hypothetical protein
MRGATGRHHEPGSVKEYRQKEGHYQANNTGGGESLARDIREEGALTLQK